MQKKVQFLYLGSCNGSYYNGNQVIIMESNLFEFKQLITYPMIVENSGELHHRRYTANTVMNGFCLVSWTLVSKSKYH